MTKLLSALAKILAAIVAIVLTVIGVNMSPTVNLTAPINGATATAPASIALAATASDSDGSIQKVEFFNGTTLLYSDSTAPYSYNWTNVPEGNYSITAVATDNKGATKTSSVANVSVKAANQNPKITLTAPPPGFIFSEPATVTLSADVQGFTGAVSKVEFFEGTNLVGTATAIPYSFEWKNIPAGTYLLTAKATGTGAVATSDPLTLVVNARPSITLDSPASEEIQVPATIHFKATASDRDGSISKVEFYQDGVLVSSLDKAPYATDMVQSQSGSYSYYAVAYDDHGLSAQSETAVVNVTAPTQLYYVHADATDTPRSLTDKDQRTVWTWDNEDPYGSNPANEDPDQDGVSVSFNLRFPGQYKDDETGLHYNYFRNYDPSTGRYIESDPIGLLGGMNTYAYASGNPVQLTDPRGLCDCKALQAFLSYVQQNGKLATIYGKYNPGNNSLLIPLNDPCQSIYGLVDIDWMLRTTWANAFGSFVGWLGYRTAKFYHNLAMGYDQSSIYAEDNENGVAVGNRWLEGDENLNTIFAPALEKCKTCK